MLSITIQPRTSLRARGFRGFRKEEVIDIPQRTRIGRPAAVRTWRSFTGIAGSRPDRTQPFQHRQAVTPDTSSSQPVARIARYRVIDRLGAGGMGEVYRARDEQLDRDVAVKVLPSTSFDDPAARVRLVREARAAAALNHPNVCVVHEVGESDGQAYIAMELVEGATLSERSPEGR